MVRFDIRSKTFFLIRFESEDINADIADSRNQLESLLPGVLIEKTTEEKPDVMISFVESEERSLDVSDSQVVIKDMWRGNISLDLWHLIYSILRIDLLSHELYPIHAACAGKDKMVLLLGHAGSGKTTVMMKLINDYGWKVFSGNRTVIDLASGMNAISGTKAITIRAKDIENYPKLKQTAVNYADRTTLTLDEKYFENRESVPVVAICNLKLEPGADRTVSLNHPSNLHTLYPFFLDTVYADTVMCDGEAVYEGKIPKGIREKLAINLKKQLANVPVINMAGSAEYLAKEINKLI